MTLESSKPVITKISLLEVMHKGITYESLI